MKHFYFPYRYEKDYEEIPENILGNNLDKLHKMNLFQERHKLQKLSREET
jgi:hypothetical protein